MNIFKFEFKRNLKTMFIWTLVCILFVIMFVALFPSMKDSGMSELMSTKLDAMPKEILDAFNLSGGVDFANISSYMAYCLQYIVMAAGIYGAILGTSALIKEETEGTIEFLYSKPVKRREIVIAKFLSSALLISIFVFLVGLSTMLLSMFVLPDNVKVIDYFMDLKIMYLGMEILGVVFLSVGFLISTVIKSSKGAITMGIGIFFATYIIGSVSKMKENLKWLNYFSPIEYVQPSILIQDGFDIKKIILAAFIIIVSMIGTFIIYEKKDMRI